MSEPESAALLACGKATKHGPHDDCVGIPLPPVLHPLPEESSMTDTAIAMRYRKKPVEISAAQWNGSVGWATPIIDWILENGGTARFHEETGGAQACLAIDTLEGTMRANPGDFIIQGVQGEFYPCKPDIFAATYDRVTDGPAT